jgi:SAM-dependent MidA family methyltransferase
MEKEKIALHLSSLKRLTDKNQMGKLFKVIGIRDRNSLPLVGLEHK